MWLCSWVRTSSKLWGVAVGRSLWLPLMCKVLMLPVCSQGHGQEAFHRIHRLHWNAKPNKQQPGIKMQVMESGIFATEWSRGSGRKDVDTSPSLTSYIMFQWEQSRGGNKRAISLAGSASKQPLPTTWQLVFAYSWLMWLCAFAVF